MKTVQLIDGLNVQQRFEAGNQRQHHPTTVDRWIKKAREVRKLQETQKTSPRFLLTAPRLDVTPSMIHVPPHELIQLANAVPKITTKSAEGTEDF